MNRLEHDSCLAIEWFQNNSMKLNEDKCHLLVGGYKHEMICEKIGDAKVWEPDKQEQVVVHIDRTLSFDDHVSNLCKKTGRKLSVLASLSSYMTLTQRRVLMKSFSEAQFGYCPLVWIFHGRALNRKINHLHERSLRIVYKENYFMNCFNNIILLRFTTETFKVCLSNYIKLKKIYQMKLWVAFFHLGW